MLLFPNKESRRELFRFVLKKADKHIIKIKLKGVVMTNVSNSGSNPIRAREIFEAAQGNVKPEIMSLKQAIEDLKNLPPIPPGSDELPPIPPGLEALPGSFQNKDFILPNIPQNVYHHNTPPPSPKEKTNAATLKSAEQAQATPSPKALTRTASSSLGGIVNTPSLRRKVWSHEETIKYREFLNSARTVSELKQLPKGNLEKLLARSAQKDPEISEVTTQFQAAIQGNDMAAAKNILAGAKGNKKLLESLKTGLKNKPSMNKSVDQLIASSDRDANKRTAKVQKAQDLGFENIQAALEIKQKK